MSGLRQSAITSSTPNTVPLGVASEPQFRRRSIADALAAQGIILIQCVTVALALITAAECHSALVRVVANAPKAPSLLYGLLFWYWWGLTAILIWKVAERGGRSLFSIGSAIKYAVVGLFLAWLHLWVLQLAVRGLASQWPLWGASGYGSLDYLNINRFFFELLIYSFAFALAGALRLKVTSHQETMRALSLEKQLSTAHLCALQMQIEPHFLFNTLNAITSLVESDRKDQVLRTLRQLNVMLKSTLRRNAPEQVSLAQELELAENYLAIEETRFADRLDVKMKIDPGALEGQVPCFLLQPIIENAIRHGISRCEQGGLIQIAAERRGDRLYMLVRDSGPGIHARSEPGHGVGLTNTRERLEHFFGEEFEFAITTPEAGGCEVVIDIPYRCSGE